MASERGRGRWQAWTRLLRPPAVALGAGLGAGSLGLAVWGSLPGALGLATGAAALAWWGMRRAGEVATLGAEVVRLEQAMTAQAGELERVTAERDRCRREADSLLEIALATGSTLDAKVLLGHITRGAAQACLAHRCTVYLLDESGAWLTPAMSQFADGSADPEMWEAFTRLGKLRLQAVAFLHETVLTREPILIPDAAADFRVPRSWVHLFRLGSLFAVPLLRQGRAVGVLVLDYRAEASRDAAEHAPLALALAEQVALALQNAGLYADAETRRREAEVMAEVVAAINASLDLDTVLRRIAEGAKELCGSEIAAVALRDPGSDAMLLRYHTGAAAGDPATDGGSGARRIGEEYAAVMREEGLVTVLVVSIRSEDRVEGLLYVGNHSPRPFTAGHRAVLGRLAEHAAIAITNGRLFEAARMRLARMTRLAALSQLMVTSLDYREVLHSVTTAALELLAGDTARLWVLDDEAGRLRLAACEERGAGVEAAPLVADIPAGSGLVGWVVAHRTKRYSPDLLRDLFLSRQERVTAAGHTSQIAVPLVVGERPLGALVVLTRARRTFTPEEQELLELFASQAASALENARLYLRAQQAHDALARTQRQLTQAQKLEAVGRLAGGVAHDFNNLLTVIQGRVELVLDELPPDHPVRGHADLIQRTGERAAALTHQLLAFSRRQILRPRVLDLNAVVAELEKMLGRVIGEDVEVELELGAELGRVKADASQIDQVLMNLALNARDAMPRGGRLTIRTVNVGLEAAAAERLGAPPGHYVMLEVRDTGVGMDEATRLRMFEPFFTTKAPGKGTGLGLATVYGIIQQSGGHVEVDSAPGRGASFRIFLPRVTEPVELEATTARPARVRAGTETVLLLEDEAEVRAMVRAMLVGQGYRVLEAEQGVEALEIAERENGPIDLLVTDVVMPQQSGPELARRLVARRPQTRVLYISGYPDDALGEHGVLHPGVAFLAKPFTAAELARKVREVLDGAGMLAP